MGPNERYVRIVLALICALLVLWTSLSTAYANRTLMIPMMRVGLNEGIDASNTRKYGANKSVAHEIYDEDRLRQPLFQIAAGLGFIFNDENFYVESAPAKRMLLEDVYCLLRIGAIR